MTEAVAVAQPDPQVQTHVEILGENVAISDLPSLADRDCRQRCVDGVVKVGRPAPRGQKGVRIVREVCTCVVQELGRRRAAAAPVVAPETGVGTVVEAPAPPARPSRASVQIANLIGALAAVRGRREEVLSRIQQRTAVIVVDQARLSVLEGELAQRQRQTAEDAERIAEQVAVAEEELRVLRERLVQVGAEKGAQERRAAEIAARAAAAAAVIEAETARDRPALQHAEQAIEKLERRLRTVVAYHPEAVLPAEVST